MASPTLSPAPGPEGAAAALILKVSIPTLTIQKTLRMLTTDTVWEFKTQLLKKLTREKNAEELFNYGIFLSASGSKSGRFLDEKRTLGAYKLSADSQLQFCLKVRTVGVVERPDKKRQKKFLEDVTNSNVARVREALERGLDPNFWGDAPAGESPLAAALKADDADMIMLLVEYGAHLDYRMNDAKTSTPLHLAAVLNKCVALKTLVNLGAWVDSPDLGGMTPLYYACKVGYTESVLRLLTSGASTEVYDSTGKGPLHMACMNNYEPTVALLVDFGASLNVVNTVGNSPLHLCATCNSGESISWLLMRGADRSLKNKSGQTAEDAANLAGNLELAKRIASFQSMYIVPPPPKIVLDKRINPEAILRHFSTSMGLALKPYKTMNNGLPMDPVSIALRAKHVVKLPPKADKPSDEESLAPSHRQSIQSSMTADVMSLYKDDEEEESVLETESQRSTDSDSEVADDDEEQEEQGEEEGKEEEASDQEDEEDEEETAPTSPVAGQDDSRPQSYSPIAPLLEMLRLQISQKSPTLELDHSLLMSGLEEMEQMLRQTASKYEDPVGSSPTNSSPRRSRPSPRKK